MMNCYYWQIQPLFKIFKNFFMQFLKVANSTFEPEWSTSNSFQLRDSKGTVIFKLIGTVGNSINQTSFCLWNYGPPKLYLQYTGATDLPPKVGSKTIQPKRSLDVLTAGQLKTTEKALFCPHLGHYGYIAVSLFATSWHQPNSWQRL